MIPLLIKDKKNPRILYILLSLQRLRQSTPRTAQSAVSEAYTAAMGKHVRCCISINSSYGIISVPSGWPTDETNNYA